MAYANLKAQCYDLLAQKINTTTDIRLLETEHKDLVIEELDAISREKPENERLFLVSDKKKLHDILGRSPDFADTIMMRMYFEVVPKKTVFVGVL